jgi:hypothetical protein
VKNDFGPSVPGRTADGMRRLWKKYIDHITANFIKHPYMYASLAVMFGFMAGTNSWPHPTGYERFLGFSQIFLSALYIYFLARAVCRLRDSDRGSQSDPLV